jgi:hypothetical protein
MGFSVGSVRRPPYDVVVAEFIHPGFFDRTVSVENESRSIGTRHIQMAVLSRNLFLPFSASRWDKG